MEPAHSQFTIQIRSPSLHETLSIDTHQNATIRELKLVIHDIHPKRPAVDDQRIIFGGKVLSDGEVLKQILERTDFTNTAPTLHLVVKPSLSNPGMATSSSAPVSHSNATTATSSSSSASVPPLPFQTHTQPQLPAQSNGSGTTAPPQPLPAYPSMLPGGYQVVALNGQYYLAPVLVPAFDPSLQQQQQQQHSHGVQGMTGAGAATGAAAAAAPAVRPRENNIQRATSVWLALKLIFVLFILCQDASLERILFYHVIAFIFFLYQTGRLRFIIRQVRVEDLNFNGAPRQQQQQQQAPAAAAPPPAPQADARVTAQAPPRPNEQQGFSTGVNVANANDNQAVRQRQQGEGQQQQQQQGQQQQQQQQTAAPVQPQTLLGTLKRGAYTFIASLWPNYGNDARVAQALDNGQQDPWEGF